MKGETKNPENAVENTIQMIKTCCVSCKKNTANEDSSVKKTKKKLMLVLNCAVCGMQKSRFIQNQEFH